MKKSARKFETIEPSRWNRGELDRVVDSWAGKRVLVVGDLGIDRYTIGSVERISPEAPVPVVAVEEEILKLGLAANVADNIRALSGVPVLVGVVGKDRGAEDFKKLLKERGITRAHLLPDSARRTIIKERIVSERQQLLRVDYETAREMGKSIESGLTKAVLKLMDTVDTVIVQDYAKGTLNGGVMSAAFSHAKRSRKYVAVDPNAKTSVESYRGAFLLTPNTKEAEKLSGVAINDEDLLWDAGQKILGDTRARYVVITRGKDGMAIFTAGKQGACLIPTYAREVYDVSGAGDTVVSVLALAVCAGASIESAAILGNLAAGVEVGKRGTATVSVAEIREAMRFFGVGA